LVRRREEPVSARPHDASSGSDINIVFDAKTPNLFLTAMLKRNLEAWLGHPVDVLQPRGMTNDCLRARIQVEAVYV
jgi:predicted nucleotidyltransferase